MPSRRNFIRQSLYLTGGALMMTSCIAKPSKKKIGIQLYSLRDYVGDKKLPQTLEKIAKAGYSDIETFGFGTDGLFFGYKPSELAEMLKRNGLGTTGGHYLPEAYLFRNGSSDEWKKAAEAAATLNQEYVVVPYMPESARTEEGYKKLAAKLNEAGEICRGVGLKAGYHNHEFEFKSLGDTSGIDILIKETDPSLVDFELDIFWCEYAGHKAVDLFDRHPNRFRLWHVKDMDRSVRKKNTEIGSGTIDYTAIFSKAEKAGMKHFYVEQENFDKDAFVSITESYNYINSKLLG